MSGAIGLKLVRWQKMDILNTEYDTNRKRNPCNSTQNRAMRNLLDSTVILLFGTARSLLSILEWPMP